MNRPKTLVCYICGREYGTHSLKIHLKVRNLIIPNPIFLNIPLILKKLFQHTKWNVLATNQKRYSKSKNPKIQKIQSKCSKWLWAKDKVQERTKEKNTKKK